MLEGERVFFKNHKNRRKFGHGRKKRRKYQNKRSEFCQKGCFSLDQVPANHHVMIMSNRDKKTIEMGLHQGALLKIIKNDTKNPNMIIQVKDSRYILSKDIAYHIRVKDHDNPNSRRVQEK